MNCSLLVAAFSALLFTSCNQGEAVIDDQDGLSVFSTDSLGKHIARLSSDDFAGRKPFTEITIMKSIIQCSIQRNFLHRAGHA